MYYNMKWLKLMNIVRFNTIAAGTYNDDGIVWFCILLDGFLTSFYFQIFSSFFFFFKKKKRRMQTNDECLIYHMTRVLFHPSFKCLNDFLLGSAVGAFLPQCVKQSFHRPNKLKPRNVKGAKGK